MQFAENGLVVSASRDKTVKLWESEGEFVLRLNAEQFSGHNNSVNTLCAIEDGKFASAGDDRLIKVWTIV
jgi:WD40 repeat protein